MYQLVERDGKKVKRESISEGQELNVSGRTRGRWTSRAGFVKNINRRGYFA
jgi:hypothetical protein